MEQPTALGSNWKYENGEKLYDTFSKSFYHQNSRKLYDGFSGECFYDTGRKAYDEMWGDIFYDTSVTLSKCFHPFILVSQL